MIVINFTNQENKPMTYGVENPGNDLGQTQQCGEVKQIIPETHRAH
jgi:hypothetical protein